VNRKVLSSLFMNSIKVSPIIINLWLMIIGTLFLFHVKGADLEYSLLGHSAILNCVVLLGSFFFKFCYWHQTLIYSLLSVNLLEWINNRWYHFPAIDSVRAVLLLICIFVTISAILYYKYGCFTRSPKQSN